jgi:hypothetical protein
MADISTESKHDLRKLCKWYFSSAKCLWAASLWCKTAGILISALAIWFSFISKPLPAMVLIISLLSEYYAWRSDRMKGMAETLLRKLDLKDSFGWAISNMEITDILARTPRKQLAEAVMVEMPEAYFASQEGQGVKRALKNIQESAWWSKHLAEKMLRYSLAATLSSVAGSLIAILVSLSTINDYDILSGAGRIVTSILMLVLSLGLIRLTLGYHSFQQKAQQTETRVEEHLKTDCSVIDAIKIYNEYHLNRASAPLIPDIVWRRNRDRLNALWESYRKN